VRVLVTRALEDARRTAEDLAGRGHQALVAPLSRIHTLDMRGPDLTDVQGVIATSSNGVRAFARRCGHRDIRVFAVGGKTAAAARSAGFTDVFSADGDSKALATSICKSLTPAAGALLHVAARRSPGDLHRELAEAGFECRVWHLYDVVPCRTLPRRVLDAFRRGVVDAVLVLSPESGRMLVDALKDGGVAAECHRVVACCISKAAAAKVLDVGFGAIRTAERPTLDAVLALLDSGPVSTHR